MRFCSTTACPPDTVNERTFHQFAEALEQESLVSKPAELVQQTRRFWNRARLEVAGWPDIPIAVPSRKDTFAVPWTQFPPSLKHDLDRMLEALAGRDLLSPYQGRPLRPLSLRNRAQVLHRLASGAVHRGIPPERLCSLTDLIQPDVVREGLRYQLERLGGQPMARQRS